MTNETVNLGLSWLALAPINQSFAALVADHPWLSVLAVVLILAGLTFSRVLLQPSLPSRYPKLTFAIDLLIIPAFFLLTGSLIEFGLVRSGLIEPSFWADIATSLVFYLSLAWLAARGLELFFWDGYVQRRTGYRVPGLLRGLSYATLLLVAAIIIMWRAGYSPTGLVVSTGLAAAVLALALQNTLADFFSGVALSVESAYGIGDWIELDDGTLGEVVDIGWRSTRLLSFNNSLFTVPNRRLASARIHNYSMPEAPYAVWYDMRLPAEIEPAQAKRMLTSAVTRARHVLRDPSPKIRLADAASVPYRYMIYVHFTNYLAQFPGRDAVFREIDAELRRYGIQPATTTHEIQTSRRQSFNIQPATIHDALKTVDLFSILTDAEIDQLARAAEFETFESDDPVVHQNATVDAIYIVWSGILRSHFTTAKGARVDIEELSVGDSFGQISVITAASSIISVTALTEAILVRIDIGAVAELVSQRPELAERFAKIVKMRMESMARAEAMSEASRIHSLPRTRGEIMQRIRHALFGPERRR